MCENRFRTWDEENHRMIYQDWDIAFVFRNGDIILREWYDYGSCQYNDKKITILMQSTNLKDKNGKGKKIWEGMGGIHPDYGKYVVKLGLYSNPDGKEHYGFYIEWQKKHSREILATRLPLWLTQHEMLFDMNIHENPDLLEKQDARY